MYPYVCVNVYNKMQQLENYFAVTLLEVTTQLQALKLIIMTIFSK